MDALQQIIRSLKAPEKRYFKLFASAFHGNTDLVKLFAALDTDKEISDEVIKKKTGIKTLPAARTNLRKLILRAMRIYAEETSQTLQMRNIISEMEWLSYRGLSDEALKEMRRAEKFGTELELYSPLIETTLIRRRTVVSKTPEEFTRGYEQLIEETEKNGRLAADYVSAILFNSYVTRYINIVATNEAGKAGEGFEKLLVKARERLHKTETIRGKILVWASIENIYNAMTKFEEALSAFHQIFAIYDANPFIKENPIMLYLLTLNNYCTLCNSARRDGEWRAGIEKFMAEFERLATESDREAYWKMKSVILHHRICYTQVTGDACFIDNVDPELLYLLENTDATNLPEAVTGAVLHYVGYYLHTGNLDKASEWLNRFYQYKHSKLGRSIYLGARLLEVILFYEQKDFDMADTKAINLYKTIMELPEDMQGEHQKVTGTLLRRLCHWQRGNKNDAAEVSKLLEEIELLNSRNNAFLKELFDFYNITGWLQKLFVDTAR